MVKKILTKRINNMSAKVHGDKFRNILDRISIKLNNTNNHKANSEDEYVQEVKDQLLNHNLETDDLERADTGKKSG